MHTFTIANREIGPQSATYHIAETACCHEGDVEFLKQLVLETGRAGADAIKFQVFHAEGLVVHGHQLEPLYQRLQLTPAQWVAMAQHARNSGMDVLLDALEPWSLEMAQAMGAVALKIHSTNVANPYFVKDVAQTGLPVIVGSSGSTLEELRECITILKSSGTSICLQHGFQGYPTQPEDTHMLRMKTLEEKFGLPVSFSSHASSSGHGIAIQNILALGMGCRIMETHVSLDIAESRTDYHSSLTPDMFASMVADVREAEKALGTSSFEFGEAEQRYRVGFKSVIVAATHLPQGHVLKREDFAFKRAEQGLLPKDASKLIGRYLLSGVTQDSPLTEHMTAE
jgi:sialic acid synthase SpsE